MRVIVVFSILLGIVTLSRSGSGLVAPAGDAARLDDAEGHDDEDFRGDARG